MATNAMMIEAACTCRISLALICLLTTLKMVLCFLLLKLLRWFRRAMTPNTVVVEAAPAFWITLALILLLAFF